MQFSIKKIIAVSVVASGLTIACSENQTQNTNITPEVLTAKETTLASAIVAEPAASSPRTYIVSPVDGAVVPSTFKVVFGLDGLGVAPAGVVKEGTGHHHLLIDLDELPDMTRPLPNTNQIRHYGGGQTETMVTLEPGQHTLQILLGDFAHIPLGEPLLSPKVKITVSD